MKFRNRVFVILILCVMFSSTLFSFNSSYATIVTGDGTDTALKEKLHQMQTDNFLEMTITEFMLDLGDMILEYITYLFNDELTVDRIVFNRVVSLNPDFFSMSKKGVVPDTTKYICNIINTWYKVYRGLAIVTYLIVLIFVGLKIVLNNAKGKADAKALLSKWTIGILILVLFPFVMKYAFKINDSLVTSIRKTFTGSDDFDEIVGTYIGGISDIQFDDIFEMRSPEYVTRSEYLFSVGSNEATLKYFSELEKYRERGDIMRMMRALAGVTARTIYAIIWFIMMFQMLILLYMYTKRYLIIAFLIIVFPIAVMEYIIGTVRKGAGTGFSAWCTEFFLNVFIQTIHAVIYGIIGGVVMNNVRDGLANSYGNFTSMNWLILIVAVNFLFEGEKIAKKILKANAASLKNADDVKKDGKGVGGKIFGGAKRFKNFVAPPK